jgi:hypothetical protein
MLRILSKAHSPHRSTTLFLQITLAPGGSFVRVRFHPQVAGERKAQRPRARQFIP